MGRVRYRRCRVCGGSPELVGPISARGLCQADAEAHQLANTAQLRARSGPMFEHWYEQMRLRFEHPRSPAE